MLDSQKKLKIGTKVRHRVDPKLSGDIVSCINEDDIRDINKQGYRYEVYIPSSGLWSIPHAKLALVFKRAERSGEKSKALTQTVSAGNHSGSKTENRAG